MPKSKPPTAGISSTDSSDCVDTNNFLVGFEVGISRTNSPRGRSSGNLIISPSAVDRLFLTAREIVEDADAAQEIKSSFLGKLDQLQSSIGHPGYAAMYASFSAFAADHMQLFGPAFKSLCEEFGKLVS